MGLVSGASEKKVEAAAPALETSGVEVCRNGQRSEVCVRGLDWRVAPGECWVVGAPPASGKTDLLATAAGLQRPAGGVVRLFGQDLAELPEPELLRQRTRVGFVFKSGGRMFADLTVGESVALPLRYHRDIGFDDAWREVKPLLEWAGLAGAAGEMPHALGSAMLGRAGLARALALGPEILFLDEPLAGLSRSHRDWWVAALEGLAAGTALKNGRKMAVIATTNDFSLWTGRRAQFARIQDGRWQALGEKAEALQ